MKAESLREGVAKIGGQKGSAYGGTPEITSRKCEPDHRSPSNASNPPPSTDTLLYKRETTAHLFRTTPRATLERPTLHSCSAQHSRSVHTTLP